MERLTKRVDGIAVLESWAIDKDPVSISRMLCNRLAAYEDTGLEPQDIISAVDMSKIACALHELNAYKGLGPIDHIRDLIKAEQDGRLVVLPCKVGDHVWADGREAIVVWFLGYKTERYLHAQFFDNAEYTDIPFYEIGKTVFLTREEAEAAMAQKGGDV